MAHPLIFDIAILTVETRNDNSWISLIANYLKNRTLPEDKHTSVKTKARAVRYTLINGISYIQSFSEPYQRCVSTKEAKHIIEKVHKGICGTHIGGRSLCLRIMTQGLY